MKAPLLRSAGDRIRRLAAGWHPTLSRAGKWMRPSQPLAGPTWRNRAEQWICALLIAIVAVVTAHRLDVDRGSFFKEDLVTGLQAVGLLSTPPGYEPANPPRQSNWIEWDWYRALDGPLKALRLKQSWGMFAPSPMVDDGWFVIIGTRVDGTVEELYNRGGVPHRRIGRDYRKDLGKAGPPSSTPTPPRDGASTCTASGWRRAAATASCSAAT